MKLVDAEALRVELGKCYVTRFEGKLPDGRICHYSDVLDLMQGRSCDDGTKAQGNKKLNEKRIHPTQKPVALYRWIFRNYVKPQWKVCDPFLGSGSSRIAASEFEIDFVGFELDAYYFAAQERRYQQEVN